MEATFPTPPIFNDKTLFFAVWCILMALVLWGIHKVERPPDQRGKPVAQLSQETGTVLFRPQGGLTWLNPGSSQQFFPGDRISTGLDSTATLTLASGQEISLKENSQITLGQIVESNQEVLTLSLLRGEFYAAPEQGGNPQESKASNEVQKSKQKTVVKLGDKTEELTSKKMISLSSSSTPKTAKDQGEVKEGTRSPAFDLRREKQLELWKQSIFTKPEINPALSSMLLAMTPDYLKKNLSPSRASDQNGQGKSAFNANSPGPVVRKNTGYEPSLVWQGNREVWWHDGQSLEDTQVPEILLKLLPPKRGIEAAMHWRPFVKISSQTGKEKTFYGERGSAFPKMVKVSLKDVKMLGRLTGAQGIGVGLVPGASFEEGEEKYEGISSRSLQLILKSWDALPKKDLLLRLSNIRGVRSRENIWLKEAPIAQGLSKSIYIKSANDFTSAIPLIRGADGFRIETASFPSGRQLYLVRGQRVVASMQQKDIQGLDLRRLMVDIHADLIFYGEPSALLSAEEFSRIMGKDETLLQQIPEVFILQKHRFFSMKTRFLSGNANLLDFILQGRKFLFKNRVKILVSRH